MDDTWRVSFGSARSAACSWAWLVRTNIARASAAVVIQAGAALPAFVGMLQADKQVLLAGVKRSALELRQKEVRLSRSCLGPPPVPLTGAVVPPLPA